MNNKEIVDAIHEALDSRDSLDKEQHQEHHRYIDDLIKENQTKRERSEAIRRQVSGWGIIVVLGSIGTFFANHFTSIGK